MVDFGTAIRASRRSRKLSQADVAERAGTSRQAINLLEAGGGRVSTLLSVQPFAPVRLSGIAPGTSFADRVRAVRLRKPATARAQKPVMTTEERKVSKAIRNKAYQEKLKVRKAKTA